jgi:predicted SprT family Zn-dependent metalloprotease
LFAKARLSITKFFSKRVSRKGNQFSRKEMHQRFNTQLLSPDASNKVIKILKHKEVANAPGLAWVTLG